MKRKTKRKNALPLFFGIVILEADKKRKKKKSIFLSNSLDLTCLNTATYPLSGEVISLLLANLFKKRKTLQFLCWQTSCLSLLLLLKGI